MTDTTSFETSATLELPGAQAVCERLAAHFGEQGAVAQAEGTVRLEADGASAELRPSATRIELRLPGGLGGHALRPEGVAGRAPVRPRRAADPPRLERVGADAAVPALLPRDDGGRGRALTPRMRRVTLAGDAAHFAGPGGLHCRLVMPPEGREPRWPRPTDDGRIAWPDGSDALTVRIYTVRRLDVARGLLDIDVVLHGGSSTPGSDWALAARPGQRVGLTGPGGSHAAAADRLLLAGDETALPAIARILERLPATCAATVRVEVADAAEEQRLATQAAMNLAWLHRDGAEAGTTDLLETAIGALDWPGDDPAAFAWVGCEFAAARAIRRHLQERGVDRQRQLVASYWRRGIDGLTAHDQDRPDDA